MRKVKLNRSTDPTETAQGNSEGQIQRMSTKGIEKDQTENIKCKQATENDWNKTVCRNGCKKQKEACELMYGCLTAPTYGS